MSIHKEALEYAFEKLNAMNDEEFQQAMKDAENDDLYHDLKYAMDYNYERPMRND